MLTQEQTNQLNTDGIIITYADENTLNVVVLLPECDGE